MKERRFIYLFGLFFSIILFFLIIPLRIFNFYTMFLYYPASGEDQAAVNIIRIFFITIPLFLFGGLIGGIVSDYLILKITDKKKQNRMKSIIIIILFVVYLFFSYKVIGLETSGMEIFISTNIAFLLYLLIFSGAYWLIRRKGGKLLPK